MRRTIPVAFIIYKISLVDGMVMLVSAKQGDLYYRPVFFANVADFSDESDFYMEK